MEDLANVGRDAQSWRPLEKGQQNGARKIQPLEATEGGRGEFHRSAIVLTEP
jgi:hypothetical protein